MNEKERELVETAGAAVYNLAVELRRACNKKHIAPRDLSAAVTFLQVAMKALEELNTPKVPS